MRSRSKALLSIALMMITALPALAASPYRTNADKAVQWLSQHANSDGSWGASEDVKIPGTAEAVMALRALNQRNAAYYWGITWLENHTAANVDFSARRILALAPHGDNTQINLAYLEAAQRLTPPGNSGWGLTQDYQGAALDSAMALLACAELGVTTNVQASLNYLKSAQLTGTDKGWAVAQESASDPLTTALVIQALVKFKSMDSTLATVIANGVTTLATKVSSSSPVHLQAMAALAYLRAGFSNNATPLLTSISASQSTDGSWAQGPYATAVAGRAYAAAMASDLAGLSDIVFIPDPYLRAAINSNLDKNGMDALTKGDLANLINLNAAESGISDLTGLEWAVNLTTADLRNNNITSTAPLNGLAHLTNPQLDGNPGYPGPDMPPGYEVADGDVPVMPLPGLILNGAGLIAAAVMANRKRRFPVSRTTNSALILIMVLFLAALPAVAADKSVEVNKKLSAGEIQQIQLVGRNVLTTKEKEEIDPEVQALKQRLSELREAITELASPGVASPRISLKITEASTDASGREKAELQKREGKVRDALHEVRRQRSGLRAGAGADTPERASMKRAAATKAEELESAVEDALDSQPEERAGKIAKLKDRLTVKSLSQAVPQPEAGEKTPTISTIVRHREQ